MDQLLKFRSDGHTLFTTLLHLNTSFTMMPCVASNSLLIRTTRFCGPNLMKLVNCCMVVLRLNHENPTGSILHTCPPHPGHMSHRSTTTPTTWSALPYHCACKCPQVLPTMANHMTYQVPWSRLITHPSPLSVHRHKPAWLSPSPSTTIFELHTYTPQAKRHVAWTYSCPG